MIDKEELLRKHKELRIPLATVEKDYVLSLIIWAIAQNNNLKKSWVFKGGTALKKCYFGDYRFSEDLDYTLTNEANIDPYIIAEHLIDSFTMIYDSFGLKIKKENLVIDPFPDKKGLVIQVKVPFQGPLLSSGALPRIKLDLSAEEILVDEPVLLPLIHNYSDSEALRTNVTCYSMFEIFAEKLRALVERTRPRDIYDITYLKELFEKLNLNKSRFNIIAKKKFEGKNLEFPNSLHEIHHNSIIEAQNDWDHMLKHQIADLGVFEHYWQKTLNVLNWVTNTE